MSIIAPSRPLYSTRGSRGLTARAVRFGCATLLALAASLPAAAGEEAAQSLSYLPLDPPFVVNFAPDSDMRYLQITLQLTTRNPVVAELVKNNMPAVRNDLVLLFSDQDPKVLQTREGKEKLRQDALATVQQVITEEGGPPEVDAVYFTSFVMQ